MKRGQEKGELLSEHAGEELIAAIAGPLFYRRWFSKEPINEHFVRRIVESAFLLTEAY